MTTPKKSGPSVLAFRNAHTLAALPENLRVTQYIVPMIAKTMGQLIGVEADARFIDWDADVLEQETQDAYRELAASTALLLSVYDIQTISEHAVHSVNHQLAATVNPLVSLHGLVDQLFRAFMQDEQERLIDDTQRLWAALEFRSEAVTGMTFAQVLG